jgi:hypothetical protein
MINNMKRLIQSIFWLPLMAGLFAAAMLPQTATAEIRYVTVSGTQNNTGKDSWANASDDLQAMINASNSGDEVWVFEGEYKPKYTAAGWSSSTPYPSASDGRNNAFVLKAGVKIYGGFTSTDETITTAPTFGETGRNGISTLSGDLGNSGNAYHVVIGANISNDGKTVLDGFIITGGNADGSGSAIKVNDKDISTSSGGGIFNIESSPVLTNDTIRGNKAIYYGGGIYNYVGSSPVLKNLFVSENTAYGGGGICNRTGTPDGLAVSPVLEDVTICYNNAIGYDNSSIGQGGGILNGDNVPSLKLTNVKIYGNKSTGSGGGIVNYATYVASGSPFLTNVIIKDNSVTTGQGSVGGGMYNYKSSPTLRNITISKNVVKNGDGGGIYNRESSPTLDSVIISENEAQTLGTTRNGGGICNFDHSSPKLTHVSIVKNSSAGNGGGIANLENSCPKLINVLISGNSAGSGGGISNGKSSPKLTNVTISGNKANNGDGGGIDNFEESSPALTNTIVWGNSIPNVRNSEDYTAGNPTYTNSLVQGENLGESFDGTDDAGTGSVQFMSPVDNDYRLYRLRNDLAINKGSNDDYLTARDIASFDNEKDLADSARLYSDPDVESDIIDLGAYEFEPVYGIELSPMPTNFADTVFGYTQPPTLTVTVTNTGNTYTDPLTVTLSNDQSDENFKLTDAENVTAGIDGINGTVTFQVVAKTGLVVGPPYTAKVTVKGKNISEEFNVSFSVGKATPKADDLNFTPGKTVYNGEPQPVTVTVKPDRINFATITAVRYSDSITAPTAAGTYAITVDITEVDNYKGAINLKVGDYVIEKAEPTIDDLEFDMSTTEYYGRPKPVVAAGKAGIVGLGEITVKYNGRTDISDEPNLYTVTVDIAEGDNYAAATGLYLGTFTVFEPLLPHVTRRVQLPTVAGLKTNPPGGEYFVPSGATFTFVLTPTSPDSPPPTVKVGQMDGSQVTMTPNGDGSYTVLIHVIRQNIKISLSTGLDSGTGNETAAALRVYAEPGAIVVENSLSEDAVIRVYALTGTLVHHVTAAPGLTRLNVAPGVYIVTADNTRWKTIVRKN